MDEKALVIL